MRNWYSAHNMVLSKKTKIMFPSLFAKELHFMFHTPNCNKFNVINSIILHSNEICYDTNCFYDNNCFCIEAVRHFKSLGVMINDNMSWSEHIQYLKPYFRSTLWCFYLLMQLCSMHVLQMFYYGIFQ